MLPFSVLPFLLAVVALQRLAELVYSGRTRRLLRASGARKVRPDGMTLLVLAHVAWFVGCWWEARRFGLAFDWWTGLGLDLFVVGAALRYGAMQALGWRWSTRVWVLPDAPLVTSGPYRFFRHPIYLGVSLELAGLPVAFGLWRTALAVGALNAVAVLVRIRFEERALGVRG